MIMIMIIVVIWIWAAIHEIRLWHVNLELLAWWNLQAEAWMHWSNWRRWMHWSTWQQWWRSLFRRLNHSGGDNEFYSDASNAVTTPASVETPLTSQGHVSRGTSLNIIRDPYSSTPVRFKSGDPRLIDRHRTLMASKSLTQENIEVASPLLAGDVDDACDASKLASRSLSADSVFTILIRIPQEGSSSDNLEHPTIRMIPANGSAVERCRSSTTINSTKAMNEQQQQQRNMAVRSRSVPLGEVPRAPPPPASILVPAGPHPSGSSLLCGTNLHLPSPCLSLSKLTSLNKPNHLPLKNSKLKNHVASPWVPRSCMPVAQSPLVVRARFTESVTTATSPTTSTTTAGTRSATLPLDAKIIPKQLARGSATTGAVQTVSGTIAVGGGSGGGTPVGHPPVRRPIYNAAVVQAQAAAAAAKKSNKKPKKKNQEKRQEKKAAKTLSAILLAFILTWTPYNVLILFKALAPCEEDDCFPKELWDFCYYLCYINSTINPVCYALCNASFRRTYVRILTCKWHSRTKTAVQRGVYN